MSVLGELSKQERTARAKMLLAMVGLEDRISHLPSELSGGEDHALLATFPPQASRPEGFRVVGEVVPAGGDAVLIDGQAPRGRGGWDPYADWDAGRG